MHARSNTQSLTHGTHAADAQALPGHTHQQRRFPLTGTSTHPTGTQDLLSRRSVVSRANCEKARRCLNSRRALCLIKVAVYEGFQIFVYLFVSRAWVLISCTRESSACATKFSKKNNFFKISFALLRSSQSPNGNAKCWPPTPPPAAIGGWRIKGFLLPLPQLVLQGGQTDFGGGLLRAIPTYVSCSITSAGGP